jgi:hypothetical protein
VSGGETHSVKRHLDVDAESYDAQIRRFIPHYDDMLATGVELLAALAPPTRTLSTSVVAPARSRPLCWRDFPVLEDKRLNAVVFDRWAARTRSAGRGGVRAFCLTNARLRCGCGAADHILGQFHENGVAMDTDPSSPLIRSKLCGASETRQLRRWKPDGSLNRRDRARRRSTAFPWIQISTRDRRRGAPRLLSDRGRILRLRLRASSCAPASEPCRSTPTLRRRRRVVTRS